jgi:hypothetical protein
VIHGYFSVSLRSFGNFSFHNAARVWLPWPRVLSLDGITTAGAWDVFDLALEDPELRRVDQVVSRINRQEREREFFRDSAGIVIV